MYGNLTKTRSPEKNRQGNVVRARGLPTPESTSAHREKHAVLKQRKGNLTKKKIRREKRARKRETKNKKKERKWERHVFALSRIRAF